MYLQGKSIIGIASELEKLGIKSPTGKEKWCKRTIDTMLSNEKYSRNARLLDNGKHEACIWQRIIIRRFYRRKHIKRFKSKNSIEVMSQKVKIAA